ncbi:MAG: hypothetical protein JWO08_4644, partial [Verrucomicrobiaceae bacterium]|nr:hypothetical protein [Verrucomicrobiaceae bacterium]
MSQIVLKHLSVDKVVAIAELAQRSGEEPATSESLDVLPSAEEVQLEDMIKELNENELRELTALMWLGRGFGGETVESWGQLVE